MRKGVVVRGNSKNKKWRLLPTANIVQSSPRLSVGSYAGKCHLNQKELGICLITVYATAPNIIEVYISDFDKDIYGKEIRLSQIKEIKYKDFKTLTDKGLELIFKSYESEGNSRDNEGD